MKDVLANKFIKAAVNHLKGTGSLVPVVMYTMEMKQRGVTGKDIDVLRKVARNRVRLAK